MKKVLKRAIHVIRDLLCKILHIPFIPSNNDNINTENTNNVVSMTEEGFAAISASFQSIISCLEGSEEQSESGTKKLSSHKSSRRPSCASLSREIVNTHAETIAVKREFFEDGDANSVSNPGQQSASSASVLYNSSMITQAKLLTTNIPEKRKSIFEPDEHAFYHSIEQMTEYTGSAMLLLLELCHPVFATLHTIISTMLIYSDISQQLYKIECINSIQDILSELREVIYTILKQVISSLPFTTDNLQVSTLN
jgi:hypothetical protein